MQTTKSLEPKNFTHPAIEKFIADTKAELNDYCQLQGKEDAMRDAQLSEQLFKIKIKDFVHSRTQLTIDFIRNTLLVTSKVFDAAEVERKAPQKMQEKNNEINNRRHLWHSLKRKLQTFNVDQFKRKFGSWLIPFAIIVGLADGALANAGFRHGGYTIMQALLASFAIAFAISVSHFFYTVWIKKAKTEATRILRTIMVLIFALIFFYWLGNLRAAAANEIVNISLDGNNETTATGPNLNDWAIAGISFVLFSAVFFLSLLLYRSKEERLLEQEYDKVKNELLSTEQEIKRLEKERDEIEINAALQKSESRKIFDYATSSIRKCKNIGIDAVNVYKQMYTRFHNDIIPAFFSEPINFTYDESFQFTHLPKTEPA